MKTQDIVRRLWDEAGRGNIAVWADGTITLVPKDYKGETGGKKPVAILKPIALVNKYDFLDFALADEELLTTIEETIRAGGGTVSRG
ncbi:MAG TPA: hypothetical protein HA264_08235 [Methanolinea sp.]|jgi:hypothetical protein|nr:MAG: hypothetical protein A4E36_01057 [Methanoregulaceae archaeon PtaB.Bin009]OPY38126.1 MAG: hypothetical protein A4E41_02128 [Methanoregulaceae archaeon PtaU1.Bin066]HII77001.1 hypothetical protein [Methanolinea sp.]HNQ29521.1 hypothetical protein [Methanolinea sp.]